MANPKRPPKPKKENPILAAISSWLSTFPPSLLDLILGPGTTTSSLLASSPKRWVVYEPMVLLPSGSFTSPRWATLLAHPSPDLLTPLWTSILSNISQQSRPPLTHLAINDGIPLHLPTSPEPGQDSNNPPGQKQENLLRRPTNLLPLHGSFGPATSTSPSPSPADFASALWVSTNQNGLAQTWAPRWTMFSRGNVKEKARLLAFHSAPSPSQPETRRTAAAAPLPGKLAVDLYAGIGYFVFSYARLGLRVLCWEVNAWSVEGLRRGAARNRFSVRVVTAEEEVGPDGGEQIVVFLEDNARAAGRLQALGVRRGEVVHVNCGLLPSSEGSWRTAWEAVEAGGWVHVHENVGVGDIERRRGEIQGVFGGWCRGEGEARVEHVELVKTFAPGVWHCVFDVFITRGG
ncbi:S-adenosyl-L-methionine-dependent methyltransferase [Schizothecium vesticola]|uniref:tRNA wybutosine-synthesizing protein 2 n=1 Tax=Schizothecium vesticola TaxID=314040 RepID=A0AA40JZH0_9PEZI|nr:S-adenosyl-L-methionine-dependent methyltransferase [Schizothecium vesticola]